MHNLWNTTIVEAHLLGDCRNSGPRVALPGFPGLIDWRLSEGHGKAFSGPPPDLTATGSGPGGSKTGRAGILRLVYCLTFHLAPNQTSQSKIAPL